MMEKQLIPQLRFSEFEETFKAEIFDDILSVTRLAGYEYSKYWKEDDNKEIIALRGYNIGSGKLELRDLSYISNKLSLQLKRSRLNKGDIIYPCVGTIGNAVVIEENDKYHIQQNIAKITCNKTTNPFFISQFLMSHLGMKEVLRFNATSSQPNVLVGSLRQFKINLPSLPEQQKIASFLTDVDDKITKLTKKKVLLELYKKGIMQKIFNQELRFKDDEGNEFPVWEEKKLGELTSLITKGTTPTSLGFSYLKEGVNFVKVECINNTGFIDIQSTPKVSQECNIALKRSELKVNDILFSIAGTLGRTALVKEKDLPANTNQALAIIRLKSRVNLSFINYSLNTSNIENYILKMVSVGAQPNLNLQQVGAIIIKLPTIAEQTKIANFLSDIDVKIEALNTKIENSKSFKKGLLQKMFV